MVDIGVYKSTELYPSSLFSVPKQLGVDWISSTQVCGWHLGCELEKSDIILLGLHPWYTTNKYVTYLDVIYCYPTLNYMIWSFLEPWAKLITLPTSPSFPQLLGRSSAIRKSHFVDLAVASFAKGWPQNAGEKCDMSWGYHGDILNNHDYILKYIYICICIYIYIYIYSGFNRVVIGTVWYFMGISWWYFTNTIHVGVVPAVGNQTWQFQISVYRWYSH